jgi:hypothetical protein
VAINVAGTAAVNCEPLANVVEIAVPFQSTVAPERNPVPFTVSVKAGPPAVAEVGFRLVITGAAALILKVTAADELPPGFVTTMFAVPAAAMRLAGTAAVNCVALTNVVSSAFVFQYTEEFERKPEPFTVIGNAAPPAVADDGLRPLITGGGVAAADTVYVTGMMMAPAVPLPVLTRTLAL